MSTDSILHLDPNNAEFNAAVDLALRTKESFFLTGKAGTGKTTFLKYVRTISEKRIAVIAPTGVAAVNARGKTIHSFFKLDFRNVYLPGDVRLQRRSRAGNREENIYDHLRYNQKQVDLLNNLDTLIIDEVSMVQPYMIDMIDQILRVFRKRFSDPFGGVQMILIGDLFQLPAFCKDNLIKNKILSIYPSMLPLDALAFRQISLHYIELSKVYRQQDKLFVNVLNKIRVGEQSYQDLQLINERLASRVLKNHGHKENFWVDSHTVLNENGRIVESIHKPAIGIPVTKDAIEDDVIQIATKNSTVDNINESKLEKLVTPLLTFDATVSGIFDTSIYPCDLNLKLKIGAQVMLLKNSEIDGLFNGSIGTVTDLRSDTVSVKFGSKTVSIGRHTWDNIEYKYNSLLDRIEADVIGTFTQFPLRLAWAITVHKSQGLTFERAHIDIDSTFTTGQLYVALSRCTSLDGLTLQYPINSSMIKVDSSAIRYDNSKKSAQVINNMLPDLEANYLYATAKDQFIRKNYDVAYDLFVKAMKLRNDLEDPKMKRWVVVLLNRYFDKSQFDLLGKLGTEEISTSSVDDAIIFLTNSLELT